MYFLNNCLTHQSELKLVVLRKAESTQNVSEMQILGPLQKPAASSDTLGCRPAVAPTSPPGESDSCWSRRTAGLILTLTTRENHLGAFKIFNAEAPPQINYICLVREGAQKKKLPRWFECADRLRDSDITCGYTEHVCNLCKPFTTLWE